FRLGDTRLLLERGAPSALVYLRVDDVRASVEQLRADGVSIADEPHVIFTDENGLFGPAGAQEWMAFITDSEGNLVGLASQNASGPDAQARAVLIRERASSISSSVVWNLVTRRMVSSAMR